MHTKGPRSFFKPGSLSNPIAQIGGCLSPRKAIAGCDGHQISKDTAAQSINQLLGNHSRSCLF